MRFSGTSTSSSKGSLSGIKTKANVKFVAVDRYVVAYDETAKIVLTILHGRRDLPKLFP